jgi:hypothetical protein
VSQVLAYRPRHLARRRNPRPLLHLAATRPADQKWALLEKDLEYYRSLDILPSDVFDTLEAEIQAQAGELAGVWNTQFVKAIYDSLEEALAAGTSPSDWLPEAAALIQAYGGATSLGIYSPDATGGSMSSWYSDLVFRQNTLNALNAGRYAEMFFGPSAQTDAFWMFATAEDERVCEICDPLDGTVFAKGDDDGREYLPSCHFNCMPAETRVEGLFRTGFRSLYSGEMVEVETERGARLTVTADHPVFTEAGLIPGRDVGEGSRVFRYRARAHSSAAIHDENVPAGAAQVFGSLEKAGTRCDNPGRRVNLYGNAGRDERDIDVVTMDRELANGPANHLRDLALVAAFAGDDAHHAKGGAVHLLVRTHPPAHSLPRSGALTLDGRSIHPGPFKGLRFGTTALLDAALAECADESPARHAALLGEAVKGEAGLMALEKVVKVRKFDAVMRPTFDFEAAHGVIVADGIAVGNCRCQAIQLDEAGMKDGGYTVSSGQSVGIDLPEGFAVDRLATVPDALRRAA